MTTEDERSHAAAAAWGCIAMTRHEFAVAVTEHRIQ